MGRCRQAPARGNPAGRGALTVGRWFRMYDAVLDDPKVQRLPDPAFRAWVNLMCLASRGDGHIARNWDDISFALRAPIADAKDIVAALVRARLIDEKKHWYEPHNWKARQYKSDVSTARVKRFRKRSESVSETPPEQIQSRAEQNRTQTRALRASRNFISPIPGRKPKARRRRPGPRRSS